MIVVSDTSPIANLLQIGQLSLLQAIFEEVIIPPAVQAELLELQHFQIDLTELNAAIWIQVQPLQSTEGMRELLEVLDEGESEAILLAQEINADWILMDERTGTQKAEAMGLRPIGLVGVLIKAKEKGLILQVTPVIEEMRTKVGFWISDKFLASIKQMLKE